MAKKQKPADESSMDAPVRVQLSDTAVAERGRALAEKLGVVASLRDRKRKQAEEYQKDIDGVLDECESLRLEILEGAAEKRQGDLFVHEVAGAPDPDLGHVGRITDDTAKEVLAKVAQKAGEPPFDFAGDDPRQPPVEVNAKLEKSKRGGKGASA